MSMESWSHSHSSRPKEDTSRKERDRPPYDDRDRKRDDYSSYGRSDRKQSSSSGHRSYDTDRDSRRYRERDRGYRGRYRSRSRSSSYESRSKRKHSRDRKSESKESKSHKPSSSSSTSTNDRRHVRILRASRSRSISKTKSPPRDSEDNRRNAYMDMYNKQSSTKIISSLDEDFDKEKIHKEMQERLIQHLAKEGKVYPPPKQQASHPIFANDGSFLETFKKLQQEQHQQQAVEKYHVDTSKSMVHMFQQQPVFGKRRGGKILKTGIVQKPKIVEDANGDVNQNDAWALYLQEVKKYKNVSCDADSKTRPLVK